MQYVPTRRISASVAMNNAYFYSLGSGVFRLKDNESLFEATDLHLSKDPGYRPASRQDKGATRRRLTVLF